ncbi:MAG: dehydrogenase [Gammaproteobacteria bacterium]|nr:dehydrogenase [Gammaproteobacteria bacterium]
MNRNSSRFRVGLTRDFLNERDELEFKDLGLSLLDASSRIEYEFLAERATVIRPEQVRDYDGIITFWPSYDRESFAGVDRLLGIALFGVGYDHVDVQACTDADVVLFNVAGAVDRPVAEAILTLMLSLSHHLFQKDRIARSGRWDDSIHWMGSELRDKVIGTIGLGGIARELCRLLTPFGVKQILVYDPLIPSEQARAVGSEVCSLERLLKSSDFVTINCPLNETTRNMIALRELSLMKPTAFLINTARGAIVNEQDLFRVLSERRIRGAGLDVFSQEPLPAGSLLLTLDNVIITPHALAWTDELFRDIGTMSCLGMSKLAHGEVPDHVVNKEVLRKTSFQRKLGRFRG